MERVERVGKNEALFREVNERIREITPHADAEFLCECADETCTRSITMTFADYEAVRRNSAHFFVVPGHVEPDLERVIAQHGGYEVVEKDPGRPAAIAAETDPRS